MSLASMLATDLPSLRRHARALTGAQVHGDALVAATLEAITANRALLPAISPTRLALFKAFQGVWMASSATSAECGAPPPASVLGPDVIASARLAAIHPLPRQALLLAAMEGFLEAEIAFLINCDAPRVETLIAQALAEIARQTRTRVLIIEDEPIIALDIETIVNDLGHHVTGIAATRTEAIAMVVDDAPGLVLADIQLRDGSSGIDTVQQILARQSIPAIFITGFPDRLLTGQRPEPTFLITKPFQVAAVQAAISQALFFNQPAPAHE